MAGSTEPIGTTEDKMILGAEHAALCPDWAAYIRTPASEHGTLTEPRQVMILSREAQGRLAPVPKPAVACPALPLL